MPLLDHDAGERDIPDKKSGRHFREKAIEYARRNPDSTKARILRSAERLFATRGYKGTTTRDIAEAARVNIAMVHYHWGSKEELWNAVHYNLFSQAMDRLKEAFVDYRQERSPRIIKKVVSWLFNFMADNPNIPLLMQQSREFEKEVKPWIVDAGGPPIETIFPDLLEAAGVSFDPVDIKMALYCISGTVEFFFIRPDLVKLYFGEDGENFSPEFRDRAIGTIWTLIERFARLG